METIELSARPRNRDDLAAWYAAALEDQVASGLSVAEYAGLIGVTATTLYEWRRRLAVASSMKPESADRLRHGTLNAEQVQWRETSRWVGGVCAGMPNRWMQRGEGPGCAMAEGC